MIEKNDSIADCPWSSLGLGAAVKRSPDPVVEPWDPDSSTLKFSNLFVLSIIPTSGLNSYYHVAFSANITV